jgi:hypothetical protein
MAVEHQLLVDDPDAVAGQADGPLHVILLDIHRIAEHDDIAAAHLPIGQDVLGNGARGREGQLIHQDVIAHQQRGLHGRAGDDEGLHQAGGSEQQQDHGDGPLGNEAAVHFSRNIAVPAPQAGLLGGLLCLLHFPPVYRMRRTAPDGATRRRARRRKVCENCGLEGGSLA